MKHEEALALMQHAVTSDRMAQAYILAGPPYTAGRDLTLRILELLYCDSSPEVCGQCPGCLKTARMAHEDVLWVEPQMRSRTISIGQVRELQERMTRTSMAGGWKACVLTCADRLGQEASNAFLKTLEEPPGKTVFLLLTENPEFLLSTIRSRCQTIRLDGQSQLAPEIEAELVGILTDPLAGDVLQAGHKNIAAYGQSERLQAFLKGLKQAAEDRETELARGNDSVEGDVLKARASARYREIRAGVLRSLGMWYRDVMVLRCGGDENLLHYPDHLKDLKAIAERSAVPECIRRVRVVDQMHEQLERNMPEGVVLDSGLGYLVA